MNNTHAFLNGAPVAILCAGRPVCPTLPSGHEGLNSPVLIAPHGEFPRWAERTDLSLNEGEPVWGNTAPTEPGTYVWRKAWNWEPVTRELKLRNGVLCTFAHRFEQWVDARQILGEWQLRGPCRPNCNPAGCSGCPTFKAFKTL